MESSFRSILLVDDEPNDVTLIRSALEEVHFGNQIVVAEDGEEALDYMFHRGRFADCNDKLPVFILLDIKMPMMDGIDVLKIIRNNPSFDHVPVIMMTSSRDTSDLEECYKYGANLFVVKPVNIGEFIKVGKEVGKYRVVINEIPT
jgi:CheY-like chemotaxis protein